MNTSKDDILTQEQQRDLQAAVMILSKKLQDRTMEQRARLEGFFSNKMLRGMIRAHVTSISAEIKERAHCGRASMQLIEARLERAIMISWASGMLWIEGRDEFDNLARSWGFTSVGESAGSQEGELQGADQGQVDSDLPAGEESEGGSSDSEG